MMANSSLTKCDISDLDEVLFVAKATFIQTFAHDNDPKDFNAYVAKAFSPEQIARELSAVTSSFYLLKTGGEPAGYLKLNSPPTQTDLNDPESLEIERIYLFNQFHGKGFGKLLFDKAMEVAKATRVKYLWLGVWDQNHKAIRFYKDRGFYQFARHPFKLGSDLQSDLLMRLDL